MNKINQLTQLASITKTVPVVSKKLGGQVQDCVDARKLYEFLRGDKPSRVFADWVKDRIEEFGFIEGEDFFPISGKSSGGRPSSEYTITMNMAKELAMLEKSEVGRSVRKYFIACEQELRNFTGLGIDLTGLRKQLKSGMALATQLGYDSMEAVERACEIIKKEHGADCSKVFPDIQEKLFVKNNTYSLSKLASALNTTQKRVKDELENRAIIQIDMSREGIKRHKPGWHQDKYIYLYDKDTGRILYSQLCFDMLKACIFGGCGKLGWSFETHSATLD